jgi:FtsH-binding integral membrane protein
MSFTVALVQLALLASPWLTKHYVGAPTEISGAPTEIYSGIGLILPTEDTGAPRLGLGVVAVVGYLALVLTSLVRPPGTAFAIVRAIAGLAFTVLILVSIRDSAEATGAPYVALILWLVAAIVAMKGWSAEQRLDLVVPPAA